MYIFHPLSVYLWLYTPLLDFGPFFSFLILYTVDRALWTGYQPVARPLPTHRTTETYLCLEWNSNPLSQRSRERRQHIHALDRAVTVIRSSFSNRNNVAN
jgi:hypothetical protein